VFTSILSLSRIIALWKYYHAPLSVIANFETHELPRLLNISGLLPAPLPNVKADDQPRIDLSPVREFNLTLCLSKEWHRFPGHYLIPDGIRVDFVKSEFNGLLPGHFGSGADSEKASAGQWWMRPGTRVVPDGLNDLNKEEPLHHVRIYLFFRLTVSLGMSKVSIDTCDYLIDLDFPKHPVSSLLEPRYSVDTVTWERVYCLPFLDARHSPTLSRTLWMPLDAWESMNEYGDYCLLRNKVLVTRKAEDVKAKNIIQRRLE
jgi:alpha-1,2-mannosyltransferase